MQKTVIVLPNGKEISSGNIFEDAISSSGITQCVNSGSELTLGSVCSSMVELSIITKSGDTLVSTGDEITVYRENDDGIRAKVGLFTVEKPTQASKRSIKITAYDRVTKLDRDISEWVFNLNAWPYTLYDFAKMVCTECGLELTNLSLPNGSHLIKKFKSGGATGRSVMQKICEACGCFGVVNADGKFVIDWYKHSNRTIKVSEIVGQSLNYEGYATHLIEKVQIKQTESDVGTIWPSTELKQNTYVISGNPLLTAETTTDLQNVAKTIYDRLHSVTYTPCKFSMFAPSGIRAGDVINVLDANGKTITVYIMTKKTKGQREDFECVGSYRRDSVMRTNNQKFETLIGKVFELKTDVEGLDATVSRKISDLESDVSNVNIKADGISTSVSSLREETKNQIGSANNRIDTVEKTVSTKMNSEQVSIEINKALQNGVDKVTTSTGFTFDDKGLKVIKSGIEMETVVTENGMTVNQNGEKVLAANNQGVDAKNLHATTYLIVGKNSRFEDYGSGYTGCFWIGG